jgi:hypothetical protein
VSPLGYFTKARRSVNRSEYLQRPRTRLFIEFLEERTTPSILFMPQKGGLLATNPDNGPVLGTVAWGMPIYTIFWGSYWATSAGKSFAAGIENSLNPMFRSSPYLQGLRQYGIHYPAGVNASGTVEVFNHSDPAGPFSDVDVHDIVVNGIKHQGLPAPVEDANQGVYFVITAPGARFNDSHVSCYHSSSALNTHRFNYGWIGTNGSLDAASIYLTHETVETMTDPGGRSWQIEPRSAVSWNEIADSEAQRYSYRLNGYLMQSYWSQAHGAYLVADGNRQDFVVNNHQLIINGDQLGAGWRDRVTIDLHDEGVRVNLNGEVAQFDLGVISNITINGGSGSDTINVGSGSLDGLPAITVNGDGRDVVNLCDQSSGNSATYTVTAIHVSRPFFGGLTYAGIASLTVNAGSGANTYDLPSTAAGASYTLFGGTNNDTVNVGSADNTLDDIEGAVRVVGRAGLNQVNLNDQGSALAFTYRLTSTLLSRSGAAAISFDSTNRLTINGGSGGNAFVVSAVPTATIVTWNGGNRSDRLTGPDADEAWTIEAAGHGSLGTNLFFTALHDLLGGGGDDTFKFTGSGSLAGTLNGGGGTNTLDYSALTGPINLNLQTAAATLLHGGGAGGFTGIQSLIGSSSAEDGLVGPAVDTNWTIARANAGSVGAFLFAGIENLLGGPGLDVFNFLAAGSVAGWIDGGGAPVHEGDWLNLSALSTGVVVDLSVGLATRVASGAAGMVRRIQNVHGSSSGSTLRGNPLGNILIGGSGADIIIGGRGPSLLIGGKGADVVTGGSAGDILIGGYTSYDAVMTDHMKALMRVLAEWQSADSYATRFHDINSGTGGGLNGTAKLNAGITVYDDLAPDELIAATAALAQDWFFVGAADTKHNYQTGEHINNS